jgi:hypothetical protein
MLIHPGTSCLRNRTRLGLEHVVGELQIIAEIQQVV